MDAGTGDGLRDRGRSVATDPRHALKFAMSNDPTGSPRLPLPSGPALGLIGVLALFLLLIGIKGELLSFLSLGNLRVLVHEGTVKGVIALGMLLIIITGGID